MGSGPGSDFCSYNNVTREKLLSLLLPFPSPFVSGNRILIIMTHQKTFNLFSHLLNVKIPL